LREQSAGAGLVGGAQVIVFRFVAFKRRGEKLIDGDRAEGDAALLAGVECDEVESVEDGQGDQEILGDFGEDSHGWARGAGIS